MELSGYLERIRFTQQPRCDLQTLTGIHHQHLLHIPYENIDVQQRTPLDFDLQRIYTKLVDARRGGWCYEMNGLLQWALEQIGFQVTRMSGAVMREVNGDQTWANHLVLRVALEGVDYLVDTGLGDGLRMPIPVAEGSVTQQGLTYRLERLDADTWRFHNHAFSNVRSFDFRYGVAVEDELAAMCGWLQTSEESPFRRVLVVQKFDADRIHTLVGKIYGQITAAGKTERVLDNLGEQQQTLAEKFGLQVDVADIWPAVEAAHARYFAD